MAENRKEELNITEEQVAAAVETAISNDEEGAAAADINIYKCGVSA
ncbi:MAG TPA: hypothetical protein VFV52_11070 [Bacilli bacterium]|nr:hypothetical protein [Bacilli bacterium]